MNTNQQESEAQQGVDSGVSEDAFEQDPVLTKYQTVGQQERWQKELEAARKERKHFDTDATNALMRYRDYRTDSDRSAKYYNIYFANTDIKMSALYARTPAPDISPRFKDQDDHVSRVAGSLLQRNLTYELDEQNFNATFKHILFDRLVPGVGIGWVRLEQEEQEAPPQIHPITGEAFPQPPIISDQNALIDYVAWDDFLWAPCKTWNLCPWVARRIPMDKAAIKDRFANTAPEDVLAELEFSDKPAKDQQSLAKLQTQNLTQATVDVYEIWDKTQRVIFWVSEKCSVPLDVQSDTNEFPDFFPTPLPPLGRFDTSNTQPISDYHQVRGKYQELDELNVRCAKLSEAMGVRFVYDKSNAVLKDLYTSVGENEGVGVENWAQLMGEKGGLAGSIQFAPLAEIASAHQLAAQSLERIKDQISEVEGISDIARGASTPYETATATTAKASTSSARLSVQQLEVARYIESLLRLKAHIISKFYQPEFILRRSGVLPQADQQYLQPALQLLKDDQISAFRLNVSVDSIQMPNWQNEKRERSEAVNALSSLLGQVLPMVKQMPESGPFALETIKFLIGGFRGSQGLEGIVDHGLQEMAQAKANAGTQPAAPTPEQVKAQAVMQKSQTDMQIAQMQEQTKQQVAQLEAQVKMMKAHMEQQLAQGEMQIRGVEAALRAKELQDKAAQQQASHAHSVAVDLMRQPPQGGM